MKELLNLDRSVLNALEFLDAVKIPNLDTNRFSRPLVVGTGTAALVGQVLFSEIDAVFANETNYLKKLSISKGIDGVFLISASGARRAPGIAKKLSKKGLRIILITATVGSSAHKYCSEVIFHRRMIEPYTYNVSAYLSFLLSKTRESPKKILDLIHKLESKIPRDLKKYNSFFFLIPEKFEEIGPAYSSQFDSLFGPMVRGRVFSFEEAQHAKTVVFSKKELFVSFGKVNRSFGHHRVNISLPRWASYGTLFALGYYFIGKVQRQHPPYFKNSIRGYVKRTSRFFKEPIHVVG